MPPPADPGSGPLAGQTVAVIGADRAIGARLVPELARRGAAVAAIGPDADGVAAAAQDAVDAGGAALAVPADPAEPGAVLTALDDAAQLGSLEVLVLAHLEPTALEASPLEDLDEDGWDRAAERSIRAAVLTLQAAYAALPDGGRTAVVLPTTAVIGAPGLVPLCTAVESIRVLAKSAARRWGDRRLTVSTIGVSLADFIGEGADAATLEVPTLGSPALPPGVAAADVADLVGVLAGPSGAGLTGAFLGADRGEVMVP